MDSLKRTIKQLRRKNVTRHWYVPGMLFDSVITAQDIQAALAESEIPSYSREEILNRIFPKATRIFAILLLLDQLEDLARFVESDQLHDAKLPFTLAILMQDIHLAEDPAKDFEEKQWELIAPIFHRGTLHRRLGDSAALPFVQNTQIGEGAFGTVYEVVIDPDHQGPSDAFSEKSNQSMVIALAALASAVEHVHNFSQSTLDLELIGCHHDLRPRNILVSGSHFILADFGLSTLKKPGQNSETPFKNGTDDYLAPECEDWENGFQAGVVHRSADIWSLGCIVAEIATYMVKGPEGVKSFQEARAYKFRGWTMHQFHQGPRQRSEAVESWLSDLEGLGLRIISLLILVARRALSIDHTLRPKAGEMTQGLRLIAVYEAASMVGALFSQVREKHPSLDMFIEHTRFKAWQRAMSLGNLENQISSGQLQQSSAMKQYDRILEGLDRLSGNLQARLDQGPQTQLLDFSGLISLIDNLQNILTREQMEILQEYFLITVLDECGESAGQIGSDTTCISLSYEIRMRANIKHISNLLAKDAISSRSVPYIDLVNLNIPNKLGDNNYGTVSEGDHRRLIWVEWREYRKHGTSQEMIDRLYERASQAAELLSRDKPASFRTLTCSGFFHQPERAAFGLIYEFPYNQKFHAVGWVHKSFSSDNIIFFRRQTNESTNKTDGPTGGDGKETPLPLSEPFLVGFNHSRPNGPSVYTSGLEQSILKQYQHPTYLKDGVGYRLEYDYYSLGIVLLEIGFWMSIAELTKGWGGSYEQQRQQLVLKRVPRLKQHMGREYAEAVRFCLEGDFGQTVGAVEGQSDGEMAHVSEEGRSRELKLEFGRRVVAPLSKYFA
ncbi:hypothetical protein ONZ43_g1577 [Nemania bipapillata]|uniref:Uncharacterized protein n=1 Tax=Nemania bipapillata TaxID=110536 RepID=A0ACC2J3Z9_9PEZI|nr:hypothetical protein ONZ43_g1577 [Nemania bipapillata]